MTIDGLENNGTLTLNDFGVINTNGFQNTAHSHTHPVNLEKSPHVTLTMLSLIEFIIVPWPE